MVNTGVVALVTDQLLWVDPKASKLATIKGGNHRRRLFYLPSSGLVNRLEGYE